MLATKIPVLGFNSQKYDLNLIKLPLVKVMMYASAENDVSDDVSDDVIYEEGEGGEDIEEIEDDVFLSKTKLGAIRFTKKITA